MSALSNLLPLLPLAGVVAVVCLGLRSRPNASLLLALAAVAGSTLGLGASDPIGSVCGLVVLLSSFMSLAVSFDDLERHRLDGCWFSCLTLCATGGALGLVLANDLAVMVASFEVLVLSVGALCALRKDARESQEAALKYFSYGGFASAFVLFGSGLVLGEVGHGEVSLSFETVAQAFGTGRVSALGWTGVAFVLSGMGFMSALVPFHMWVPDVSEGAPPPAAAFIATVVKAAAFGGWLRLLTVTLSGGAPDALPGALETLAALTLVVGSLLVLRQRSVKRMLAYLSVTHSGFVMMAVANWVQSPQPTPVASVCFYLLGYSAMMIGAFAVAGFLESNDERPEESAAELLAGLGARRPALGLALTVFFLGLAGVPPSAGFVGRLGFFSSALPTLSFGLVAAAVFASLLCGYVCFRWVALMFMAPGRKRESRSLGWRLRPGLVLCVLVTLGAGIAAEPILHWMGRGAF
ncbi:MAG: NADH-quinone oxidoreductase subunit N [Myxococcota bacterium]